MHYFNKIKNISFIHFLARRKILITLIDSEFIANIFENSAFSAGSQLQTPKPRLSTKNCNCNFRLSACHTSALEIFKSKSHVLIPNMRTLSTADAVSSQVSGDALCNRQTCAHDRSPEKAHCAFKYF